MIWKLPVVALIIAIATGLVYVALFIFVITVIYYAKSDGREISKKYDVYKTYLAHNRANSEKIKT